ncbi:hypothetical protein [Halalkalibacter sp. APA_J-10(15)]|uniref:hypothetical protein n=1 Tax=Halalkalibacter sp. APA_J-10(15) TaxID=2933805 RepID=UPI001FF46E89|nr:hypothetical protein [Halalkalibacter sp. APA_J-10(15)]MCK0472826.1 hypothetical protein [Halalkalibacter sp. APA_J-10(15)]
MNKRPYMHNPNNTKQSTQDQFPNQDARNKNLPPLQKLGKRKKAPKETKLMPSTKKTELTASSRETELTPSAKLMRRNLGLVTLTLMIFGMFFSSSSVSQERAADEVMNRTSSIIESGFVLEDTSELALNEQDFAIGDFDGGTARMLIWDFTGDSEDQIQIIVDGQIIRESHTLTSNVAAYSVPVPSVVIIQGIDQANYAVKFPERKYTIFNAVSPGGANAYTLTPSVLP